MELANRSKLGKGEKDIRSAEKKKAPLRIRVGMKQKQAERDAQQLEMVSPGTISSPFVSPS